MDVTLTPETHAIGRLVARLEVQLVRNAWQLHHLQIRLNALFQQCVALPDLGNFLEGRCLAIAGSGASGVGAHKRPKLRKGLFGGLKGGRKLQVCSAASS